MSTRTSQRSHNTIVRLFLSTLLLLVAVTIFVNRQALLDQYMVWQYQPSSEIVSITDRAEFSPEGRHLFYASHPQLLDRDGFNDACRSVATERTAVLGCYAGSRIYLFDIDNEKLTGIKEVTAAHEMLHAAYQRLPENEKSRVDALLEQQAQALGASTSRIEELMAEYAKTEPGERTNELHSIIGSEVRSLSPELEEYYTQYFSDRNALVTLAEQYQSVFAELQQRQESLASDINSLADQIESQSVTYTRNLQVLSSDIKSFNARAGSGNMTRAQYDAERVVLEARQAALRSDYSAIQMLIEEYDTKRSELAAINTESDTLNRSINSSLTPVPSGAIDG